MANKPSPTGSTNVSSDATTPTQDAPPKEPTNEDITGKPGALSAVRPMSAVEPLDADADYVEYKGRATERRITVDQWQQAKVPDQGEVAWTKGNQYKVSLDELNDKAVAVLKRDPSFAFPADK